MCANRSSRLVFLLLLCGQFCYAQDSSLNTVRPARSKYFVLNVGGGLSYYTASVYQPVGQTINVNKTSPALTVRLMWYPQYRLRIGVESGYTSFYSYNLKNGDNYGKVRLTAIPILITWSMALVKRVNIYAGFGSYFLTTRLNYLGKVNSKSLSLGSNVAIAYLQPLSKRWQLAAEAKWMNAFVTKNDAISLQAQIAWKFLQYDGKR